MKKLAIISLLFIISISFAQRDSIDFHYMGEFFNTYVYSYCLHEDLLYCQTSIGLEVFELNDELQIQKVAEYEYCDTTHYIKYYDGKIYLFPIFTRTTMCQFLASYSLTVLDVSDLDSIYECGYYDHFGSYSSYSGISTQSTIYGDTLVCIEYDQADTSYIDYWISMYHLGDSILAEEVMTYPLTSHCVSISFYDKYAYIVDFFADSAHDIIAIDFSDPSHIVETNFETGNMHNLYNVINDSILYVLSTDSITYKITSYNISDPDTLILLAEVEFTEHGRIQMPLFYIYAGTKPDIEFNDSLMFIGFSELHVINISDPDTMYIVMEDETIQKSFFLYDNYFVNTKDYSYYDLFTNVHYRPEEMKFYDYTVSDSLKYEGFYPFNLRGFALNFKGNDFVVNSFYGLSSGEIIDSNLAVIKSSWEHADYGYLDASFSESLAAMCIGDQIYLIDISDYSEPEIISNIDSIDVHTVHLKNSYLYTGSSLYGIMSYDISDPETPVFLDNIVDSAYIGVEYWENFKNYLIVHTIHVDSVSIVDISNPYSLTSEIFSADTMDIFMNTHAFSNEYIYSVISDSSIGIFKFYSPDHITLLGTLDMDFTVLDLRTHNRYLFVGTSSGLFVYDIWISWSPLYVTYLDGSFENMRVFDNYLLPNGTFSEVYLLEYIPLHELYPGWNLVSFPYTSSVVIEDELPTVVPGANFIFNTSAREFYPTSTLYSNKGFFLLVSDFGDYEFSSHTPISSVTLNLYPGWNLIGGPDADIPADILTSMDEILGPVYDYSRIHSSYETTDTLRPLKGYWILATDSLEITIP